MVLCFFCSFFECMGRDWFVSNWFVKTNFFLLFYAFERLTRLSTSRQLSLWILFVNSFDSGLIAVGLVKCLFLFSFCPSSTLCHQFSYDTMMSLLDLKYVHRYIDRAFLFDREKKIYVYILFWTQKHQISKMFRLRVSSRCIRFCVELSCGIIENSIMITAFFLTRAVNFELLLNI